MNLRILKKLSKRAAPLLPLLGDRREQFPAEKYDNFTGLLIRERKHFNRQRSPHGDSFKEGEIKRPARDGRGGYVAMWPPDHPRKGTVMVGAVSGYYEPEWDEETAWESLIHIVYWHFMEIDEGADLAMVSTRTFRTPSDYFAAARDIISENAKKPASCEAG